MCSEKELDCIKSTGDQIGNSDCLQQCSGLLVTSYELDLEKKIEEKSKMGFKRLTEFMRLTDWYTWQKLDEEFKGMK